MPLARGVEARGELDLSVGVIGPEDGVPCTRQVSRKVGRLGLARAPALGHDGDGGGGERAKLGEEVGGVDDASALAVFLPLVRLERDLLRRCEAGRG